MPRAAPPAAIDTMLFAIFLLIGVLLLLLETTVFHLLPGWFGKPDLLFLLVVYIAVRFEIFRGAVLALLFGLLMDIFSGIYLGLHPVIYLLLFFLIKGLARHLVIDESIHQAPLAVASYLFYSSSLFLLTTMIGPESSLDWSWRHIILQLLMLAIFAVPFYHFYEGVLAFVAKKLSTKSLLRPRSGNRFRV